MGKKERGEEKKKKRYKSYKIGGSKRTMKTKNKLKGGKQNALCK